MKLDVLVFAAHPDDAELAMGGTIAKLSGNGLRVGIIDLTEGELSTRGTVKSRREEADAASKALNLTFRDNMKLNDGRIESTEEMRRVVVSQIRKYKPTIIFAPHGHDRHPDHVGASKLVKDSWFLSGVHKFETKEGISVQDSFRPDKIFYYMQAYRFEPSFIVDISEYFDAKMKAVRAYKSQFYDPDSEEPETFISDPKFINYLEARSKFYGFQIGKEYGEPFYSDESIELDLISMLNK